MKHDPNRHNASRGNAETPQSRSPGGNAHSRGGAPHTQSGAPHTQSGAPHTELGAPHTQAPARTVGGVLFILIAATLWGGLGPVAKIAFAEGMTPLAVAFWRALLGWAFFVVHAGLRRTVAVAPRDVPRIAVFAVVSVAGFYGSYQLAVQYGGAARAAVLLYTAPAWVAVLAALFLGERLTLPTVGSVCLAIAGVAMISLSGAGAGRLIGAAPWIGILFGLIAGFTYALYYIVGRRLLERYSSITLFSWILVIGAAALVPFVSLRIPSMTAAGALLFIGFGATYLAYTAYARGLLRLESSQAAVIATAEPVVAAVVAYIFWGEYLGVVGYAGAALVITAVVIQAMTARRRNAVRR